MLSIIFEGILLVLKNLYRFFGFALILIIILAASLIFARDYAVDEARSDVMYGSDMDFLSCEEQQPQDYKRVFKIRVKNNTSNNDVSSFFTVRDENGDIIFTDFKNKFSDVRIAASLTNLVTTPPGSENVFYVYIDEDKLIGKHKLYLSTGDNYDEDYYGTEFEIK